MYGVSIQDRTKETNRITIGLTGLRGFEDSILESVVQGKETESERHRSVNSQRRKF